MFGLEILDVAIGLMLVYLLLSLFATALNEYIAAVLNLRGKELAKGLGRLLDDIDEGDALQNAWDGVSTKLTTTAGSLTEQLYNHRLIRPFSTRQGWMTRFWRWARGRQGNPRLPSYIPARTFALALLDVLGVDEKASLDRLVPEPAEPSQAVKDAQEALAGAEAAHAAAPDATREQAARAVAAARAKLTHAKLAQALADAKKTLADAQTAQAAQGADKIETAKAVAAARQALAKVEIAQVLAILKQDSPIELTEHLELLAGLPQADKLAGALQVQVAGLVAGAQTQLQKLHDGVEVWFNNSMDRVSGAYKRTAQGWLFVLGLLIASCMNADTIDMWRRLEADDELRNAMVRRAEATVAALDTTLTDSAVAAAADTASTDTTTPPTRDTAQADSPAVAPPTTSASSGAVTADTAAADSAKLAAVKQARENYLASRARLDSMELKLGWTQEEAIRVGLLKKKPKPDTTRNVAKGTQPPPAARSDSAVKPDSAAKSDSAQAKRRWVPAGYRVNPIFPFTSSAGFLKLFGLLLTALAISLGAPFWFDLLNKAISIRAAGRSPEERPKSPEGGPKRLAEHTPK
jgi:hypothetical protein